jgi:hypothetical protein
MEASMTMLRLGTALVLATLMTTGAFARGGGGHGGAIGHGAMARGGFPPLLLPAPPINNSTPTLTGPVGSPPSSLSTRFGSPLNPSAGTLYPNQMNSLSSIGAGRSGSFSTPASTTPPDVTPAMPSVTTTMPALGTPQIMVPERPM